MVLYQAKVAKEFPEIEPATIEEALGEKNKEDWEKAMREVFDSLQRNHAWKLVYLPEEEKIIESKWVFKRKRDSEGNVSRYKARLFFSEIFS